MKISLYVSWESESIRTVYNISVNERNRSCPPRRDNVKVVGIGPQIPVLRP